MRCPRYTTTMGDGGGGGGRDLGEASLGLCVLLFQHQEIRIGHILATSLSGIVASYWKSLLLCFQSVGCSKRLLDVVCVCM